MQTTKLRKSKRTLDRLDGILDKNSVFHYGLALPFVVIISTTLKNGAAISIAMMLSAIPTVILSSIVKNRLPRWARYVLYSLFSMGMVSLCYFFLNFLSTEIFDSIGIYLSLIAVNSLTLSISCEYAPTATFKDSLLKAIRYCIGFVLTMMLMSALRELMGAGTLWGNPIPILKSFTLPGLSFPFAGFILLGLIAALSKQIWLVVFRRKMLPDPVPVTEDKENEAPSGMIGGEKDA